MRKELNSFDWHRCMSAQPARRYRWFVFGVASGCIRVFFLLNEIDRRLNVLQNGNQEK